MAVTPDAVSTGQGAGSTVTVSHTCTGADALYVLVAERYDTAVTGATYNGVAMTSIHSQNHGNTETTRAFRLLAPAAGAHDIVVSQSASHDLTVCGVSLVGVNQGTPEGTIVAATGTGTAPSDTAASAAGDLVLDVVAVYQAAAETITVGADQTQRMNLDQGTLVGGASTQAGAASVAMTWTISASASWNHAAIPVQAAVQKGRALLLGVG